MKNVTPCHPFGLGQSLYAKAGNGGLNPVSVAGSQEPATPVLSSVVVKTRSRPMAKEEQERLRALAWRFRESRSCHWGGNDRVSPILDFCESLLVLGVDRREVLREMVCAVRCCGDCK